MDYTIADLEEGDKGLISDKALNNIPLKLLEIGCLPGKMVTLVKKAPLSDPIYIKINGSHIAIRVATARLIDIEPMT